MNNNFEKIIFRYEPLEERLDEELEQYKKRLDEELEQQQKRSDEKLEQQQKRSDCLLYTSPSPRDRQKSRMPSSA